MAYIEYFSIIHEHERKKRWATRWQALKKRVNANFGFFLCALSYRWLQTNAYHYTAIALHQIPLLKEHVKIDENRGQSRTRNFRITRFTSEHETT